MDANNTHTKRHIHAKNNSICVVFFPVPAFNPHLWRVHLWEIRPPAKRMAPFFCVCVCAVHDETRFAAYPKHHRTNCNWFLLIEEYPLALYRIQTDDETVEHIYNDQAAGHLLTGPKRDSGVVEGEGGIFLWAWTRRPSVGLSFAGPGAGERGEARVDDRGSGQQERGGGYV